MDPRLYVSPYSPAQSVSPSMGAQHVLAVPTSQYGSGAMQLPSGQLNPLWIHIDPVSGMIPQFSGEPREDVEEWLRTVKLAKNAHQWSDELTVLHAGSKLTGTAKSWYNSLPDDTKNTWKNLEAKLRSTFVKKGEGMFHWIDLNQRKQIYDETVLSYACDIERLAKKVNPAMQDYDKMQWLI